MRPFLTGTMMPYQQEESIPSLAAGGGWCDDEPPRLKRTRLGQNLAPIFDQYLRRTDLPTLELVFNDKEGTLAYRWNADERDFAMPIRIGRPGSWQVLRPTTAWTIMKAPMSKEDFEVATDLYYVNVVRQ